MLGLKGSWPLIVGSRAMKAIISVAIEAILESKELD